MVRVVCQQSRRFQHVNTFKKNEIKEKFFILQVLQILSSHFVKPCETLKKVESYIMNEVVITASKGAVEITPR